MCRIVQQKIFVPAGKHRTGDEEMFVGVTDYPDRGRRYHRLRFEWWPWILRSNVYCRKTSGTAGASCRRRRLSSGYAGTGASTPSSRRTRRVPSTIRAAWRVLLRVAFLAEPTIRHHGKPFRQHVRSTERMRSATSSGGLDIGVLHVDETHRHIPLDRDRTQQWKFGGFPICVFQRQFVQPATPASRPAPVRSCAGPAACRRNCRSTDGHPVVPRCPRPPH